MDIVGLLLPSKHCSKYTLVVLVYFTRWTAFSSFFLHILPYLFQSSYH